MDVAPISPFGDLLRRHRRAAGLTHAALAERAGLSIRAISDLERGVNHRPRRETLLLLEDALALSAQDRATFETAARMAAGSGPLPISSQSAHTMPAGLLPTLVGRARELALFERHLASLGPAVIVFLAGEPGIGKSRLLYEAGELGAGRGWTVLQSGCHRRSGQEPYAPILGALEQYLAELQSGQRRAALRGCAWLVRLLPELMGEADPLPGWILPPEQERRLMFAAVARLLANVGGSAGTLLLLDDLQWAGQDALDLLAALVRAAPTTPPMRVVAAYRDTEIAPQSPLTVLVTDLAREGRAARASLGPLPEAEAAELLEALLSGVEGEDVALRERVLERAGGVPYFLVSCAQSLRLGAVDVGTWGSALPWDVAESIRQRILVLPPAAQDLLAGAAVAGRRVARPVLLSLAPRPDPSEDEVVGALDAICHARLLIEEVEGQAYTFAHDLIREVVSADLSGAHRAALHRRVAEALERGPGEPPVDELAYHYSRAGAVERAIGYLAQAGDRARARHAYAQAQVSYQELVERLDSLGQAESAASAREKLGFILRTMARYDEALAVLERASADYRAAGNIEGMVQTEAEIATVHGLRGTAREGVARLQPLAESLDTLPLSPRGLAALYGGMARLLGEAGRYAEALAAAERASEHARVADDPRLLGQAEHRRGRALAALGRVEESIPVVEQAIPLLEVSGELRSMCNAVCTIGMVDEGRGDFARASGHYERALRLAEPLNDPTMSGVLLADQALCEFALGEWSRARADFERALVMFGAVGPSINLSVPLLGLGVLCLAEGEQDAASHHLHEAIAVAERSGDLAALRPAHSALAEQDLLEGRPGAARSRLASLLDRPGQQEADVTRYIPSSRCWPGRRLISGRKRRRTRWCESALSAPAPSSSAPRSPPPYRSRSCWPRASANGRKPRPLASGR